MSPDHNDFSVPPWPRSAASVERAMRDNAWQLGQRIEQLERERADLRRILRGLGEGVLAVDRAGIVVHANPAAIAMLGLDADSCLGSHMYVAVPHPEACDALELVLRRDEHAPRLERELTIEGEDGQPLQLAVAVRSLRPAGASDDAEPEGAIAVVTDVTELRRLEAARRDFFTNVSHELKTPITVIRGALETIADDPDMPREVLEKFVGGANRHALRLSALVTDLLALARLQHDPDALRSEPVDVRAIAADVIDTAGIASRTAEVALEIEADADVEPILGDEEAIRQALSNLIDNAIAHSDAGSVVRVRLRVSGAFLEVEVLDVGAGISGEHLERVFERFYRVDSDRARSRGGTGIGLSIVKHVAQAHGGSVSVESAPGEGSRFTLRLPRSARG
ncbi:MAG: Phosphate regulon sensor protein PhoR [Thermoleophilia bacterium]|nr:Phosphate regulon sensor protein PhoR [Thermoleophilia bacterium]MCZ4497149.1 Phosphate regulon sensor protein PhoR [Thermoleophilia bacterium]